MNLNLDELNNELKRKTPIEVIQRILSLYDLPVVTTNFRPYEAAILYAVTQVRPEMKVIWCDTGYNTADTYQHAEDLIFKLHLNIQLYVPRQTAAHRAIVLGIPDIDDPNHKIFTEQVKLEPFKRAMKEHQPNVWFTNLRKGQTTFRDSIDIVSKGADGIIKVSPFYNWSDEELDVYLLENGLPNEFNYFDPTKQLENRECGLHA